MTSSGPLGILPTLEADLRRLETALHVAVESDLEFLTTVAQHLISAGGKRVRPGFAIACAATGLHPNAPATDAVIMGGVAVELVHQGSLYHDDVMDEAETRRSVDSVNNRWGNPVAILSGDYLLGRSSEIAADLGLPVARILARQISRLGEGQIREHQAIFDAERSVDDYLRSIEGKTASLLEAACQIGAITGELAADRIETLGQFGLNYGMAFQIVDDILDLTATDEELGKPAGNDLIEGNYTLPVLLELPLNTSGELRELLTKGITIEQRDRARDIIRQGEGIGCALDEAKRLAETAQRSLDPLDDNDAARALRAAADHLTSRVAAVS